MRHRPLGQFWTNEEGATAIEYGLIAAILGTGLVLGFGQLREGVFALYVNIKDAMAL